MEKDLGLHLVARVITLKIDCKGAFLRFSFNFRAEYLEIWNSNRNVTCTQVLILTWTILSTLTFNPVFAVQEDLSQGLVCYHLERLVLPHKIDETNGNKKNFFLDEAHIISDFILGLLYGWLNKSISGKNLSHLLHEAFEL